MRGSIVDVFPSTADGPVRIDLWGDEVDRLTEFSVERPALDRRPRRVELFGCRELLPTDDVRARAERLIALEPWGREQWERLAEGQTFDGHGVLAAVADRGRAGAARPVGPDALVLLVEPRRMRDRAADLLAEEADLAPTWPRPGAPAPGTARTASPSSTCRSTGCCPHHRPGVDGHHGARGPGRRHRHARWAWPPPPATPSGSCRQLAELPGRRVPDRAWPPDGDGLARARLRGAAAEPTAVRPRDGRGARPLERGCILPAVKLAVLAESDLTGRRRAHRPARPRKRDAVGFFDDLKPGDYVVHHQHGVARYGGMVKRAIGGVERDYLLLEYRGDDKLYVPIGPDRRRPPLHRRRDPEPAPARRRRLAEGQGPGAGRGHARSPRSWWCSTRRRLRTPGHAFPPDTPVAARAGGRVPVPGDARPARGHRRREGRHGGRAPDGPARLRRRRASARPRWRSGPRSRPCRTASRWPCSCPPRCWPSSTTRPSPTASPATRCGSRC